MKKNINRKQQQARPEKAKTGKLRLPRAFISVLNGTFLTREKLLANMSFILYVAGLMLVYIAYGYHTERTVRDLHRTDADLKELRSEYISVRSRLDQREQQSQVADDISGIGLRESLVPPHKIKVDKDELKALHE